MTSREALLQLYVWMGNAGYQHDHPWVSFIEDFLKKNPEATTPPMSRDRARDTFAMAVLSGMYANPSIVGPSHDKGWGLVNCSEQDLCRYAFAVAQDALAARERKGEGK